MFHENTGFEDQNNNGPLREVARSMDPAVSGPAIAALSASASTFGPSPADKNDIATEICDVYSCVLHLLRRLRGRSGEAEVNSQELGGVTPRLCPSTTLTLKEGEGPCFIF
jgi:hypothetical protein